MKFDKITFIGLNLLKTFNVYEKFHFDSIFKLIPINRNNEITMSQISNLKLD